MWVPPKVGLRAPSLPGHGSPTLGSLSNDKTMKAQSQDVHLLAPFIPVFQR